MENSSHKEIYYVNFNQDASSLAVCHEAGYHLYNMGSIEHTNGTGLEPVKFIFFLLLLYQIKDIF